VAGYDTCIGQTDDGAGGIPGVADRILGGVGRLVADIPPKVWLALLNCELSLAVESPMNRPKTSMKPGW
jgi:hypothetical protein